MIGRFTNLITQPEMSHDQHDIPSVDSTPPALVDQESSEAIPYHTSSPFSVSQDPLHNTTQQFTISDDVSPRQIHTEPPRFTSTFSFETLQELPLPEHTTSFLSFLSSHVSQLLSRDRFALLTLWKRFINLADIEIVRQHHHRFLSIQNSIFNHFASYNNSSGLIKPLIIIINRFTTDKSLSVFHLPLLKTIWECGFWNLIPKLSNILMNTYQSDEIFPPKAAQILEYLKILSYLHANLYDFKQCFSFISMFESISDDVNSEFSLLSDVITSILEKPKKIDKEIFKQDTNLAEFKKIVKILGNFDGSNRAHLVEILSKVEPFVSHFGLNFVKSSPHIHLLKGLDSVATVWKTLSQSKMIDLIGFDGEFDLERELLKIYFNSNFSHLIGVIPRIDQKSGSISLEYRPIDSTEVFKKLSEFSHQIKVGEVAHKRNNLEGLKIKNKERRTTFPL
ncbi:hypothetical protein P9112_009317 [Eukaryota sp. TZLM1-RC]